MLTNVSLPADYVRVSNHRDGDIAFKRLLHGNEGAPDNYELSLVRTFRYRTPRHRHNHDQLRLGLISAQNYAPGCDIKPGNLLYLPEGAYYGPQNVTQDSTVLALQFGGASGHGFLSYQQVEAANRRLNERGSFKDGIYYDAEGPVDGYEAVWTEATGAPVVYAPRRIETPVLFHTESFVYRSVAEGVAEKVLASVGERGLRFGFLRLDEAARFQPPLEQATTLYFTLTGHVGVAGATFGAHEAFAFEAGQCAPVFKAETAAELFTCRLHRFDVAADA